MLLSLRRVADPAVIHAGELTRLEPPTPGQQDLDCVRATLSDRGREFAVVHRFSPTPGKLVCSYDVLWDPEQAEWEDQLDQWSGLSGELFFFDNEIVWQQHHSRVRASEPPEQCAQHGLYLVDGYISDDAGRVVCGGPY